MRARPTTTPHLRTAAVVLPILILSIGNIRFDGRIHSATAFSPPREHPMAVPPKPTKRRRLIHRRISSTLLSPLRLSSSSSSPIPRQKPQQQDSPFPPPDDDDDDDPLVPSPPIRGKVNEIDFCMAPSDVSLSRSYSDSSSASTALSSAASADIDTAQGEGAKSPSDEVSATSSETSMGGTTTSTTTTRGVSLTRALNSASNRAVRRILLSRSWPSAEALNLSLRQVLASGGGGGVGVGVGGSSGDLSSEEEDVSSTTTSSAKCPVPRPILNIIMRRRNDGGSSLDGRERGVVPSVPGETRTTAGKRGRTDEEWVEDQIMSFRGSYGSVPGYDLAEAYLECILSLATSGVESPRVTEVLAARVYDESYRRVVSVLKSVGTVFEEVPGSNPPLTRIASKLVDQDICLSMLDKIAIAREEQALEGEITNHIAEKGGEATTVLQDGMEAEEAKGDDEVVGSSNREETNGKSASKERRLKFRFWRKGEDEKGGKAQESEPDGTNATDSGAAAEDTASPVAADAPTESIKRDDLGGVLLSAEEPTVTRQLNVLSNIVQRAMLFGGDQELLVLSETLDADKPAFVQRWYPDTGPLLQKEEDETRPGVQYLNCLVRLLKDCYSQGGVADLDPALSLPGSYTNAYERLTASLVELGSGYVKPIKKNARLPKTAQEEFGRFAQWEAEFRKSAPQISPYPEDLVGSWQVKDEIGGKTIGVSTVVFQSQGEVEVAPPMKGLRWRLDPGPTHLDTCTFQVLSDDGAILQYKGFVDRGARLEARFSRRAIKIRGAVTFQMREGGDAMMGDDYRKDMLPINYKTGTTRFVMSKSSEEDKAR